MTESPGALAETLMANIYKSQLRIVSEVTLVGRDAV